MNKTVAFFEALIAVVGCMMIGYHVGKIKADQWYAKHECVHEFIIGFDAETTPFQYWPIGSCLAAATGESGRVRMILIPCDEYTRSK